MTFEDVINEQKELRSLKDLHVSLGSGATPDLLRKEFISLNAKVDKYNSFSDIEREQAKNARLNKLINNLTQLSFMVEYSEASILEFKNKVFNLTDLIPDVDLEVDIDWMENNRTKL